MKDGNSGFHQGLKKKEIPSWLGVCVCVGELLRLLRKIAKKTFYPLLPCLQKVSLLVEVVVGLRPTQGHRLSAAGESENRDASGRML